MATTGIAKININSDLQHSWDFSRVLWYRFTVTRLFTRIVNPFSRVFVSPLNWIQEKLLKNNFTTKCIRIPSSFDVSAENCVVSSIFTKMNVKNWYSSIPERQLSFLISSTEMIPSAEHDYFKKVFLTINSYYNLQVYPESSQTSKKKIFVKIVNGFVKSFILHIWHDCEYDSAI